MSPATATLPELEPEVRTAAAATPRVRLVAGRLPDDDQAGRDRRAYERLRDHELGWVRSARLGSGPGVSLVDLSAGGALLESAVPLRPSSLLTLELAGAGVDTAVQFRVLRCEVGALRAERTIYRGACEFMHTIELPGVKPASDRGIAPGAFIGLDLALKHLVERTGPAGGVEPLGPDAVLHALDRLRARALSMPLDPIAAPLAALLTQVVPALERSAGLRTIVAGLERELRHTVPQASLRLTEPGEIAAPDAKSILVSVPGATAPLVSIDLPRGVVLSAWQSRVLRIASRVIALLQRLESSPPSRPSAAAATRAPDPAGLPTMTAPVAEPALCWQKIVVRYAEGQILKGYTQDFSPSRPQFSLWPSVAASPQSRVIVPLARLKGVFFVRDFDGNPGYVERTELASPQHGRRIEVTLSDDEVIVGTTLSYRYDGHGFFVVPLDPLANNIRIFVVASSVRQVRFP